MKSPEIRIIFPEMAQPGIPDKAPKRKEVPDIINPFPDVKPAPQTTPKPVEPVTIPHKVPVPTTR